MLPGTSLITTKLEQYWATVSCQLAPAEILLADTFNSSTVVRNSILDFLHASLYCLDKKQDKFLYVIGL